MERPLGQGGMAEVWLASNVHLGTPVAIKFLNQQFAGRADVAERFLNEGRRQGALDHPNIVKVYGFETANDQSFLVLQYIDGEALDLLLQRHGPMQPAHAVQVAQGILNALQFAHSQQIVHRDVKPSNILIDRRGVPYLGDFGIVLAVNDRRLTQTGTVMGTPHYMSPEQIGRPREVDHRSDIYSFGCVLYEMLTGAAPFDHITGGTGDTDFAVKMAHMQTAPPSPRMRNPNIPEPLEQVILRCLAKDPNQRFQSCAQVAAALQPQTPPPQKKKNRLPVLAGIAALGLSVFGGAAAYLWPREPVIATFEATPAAIYAGDQAMLQWGVREAREIEITSLGKQPLVGAEGVKPQATETFRLTARNFWKTAESTVTVTVAPRPTAAIIRRFEISPTRVKPNEPATLSWDVGGATRVEVGGAPAALTGNTVIRQDRDSTYLLRAWGANGEVKSAYVRLQVDQPGRPPVLAPPEIVHFSATPSTVKPGEPLVVRWKVIGATSVTVGKATVEPEGYRQTTLQRSDTSTLVAIGPGGKTSRTLQITVVDPGVIVPPPSALRIVSLRASPVQYINGGPMAYLHYSTAGAKRISIQPDVGILTSTSGTVSVFPRTTTVYRMTAYDQYGASVSQDVEVTVPGTGTQRFAPPPAPDGPSWNVMHHHSGQNPAFCHGVLLMRGGRLVFSSRTDRDGFDVPFAEVVEVATNKMALSGYRAFHVKLASRNYNFAPQGDVDSVVRAVNRAIGR